VKIKNPSIACAIAIVVVDDEKSKKQLSVDDAMRLRHY